MHFLKLSPLIYEENTCLLARAPPHIRSDPGRLNSIGKRERIPNLDTFRYQEKPIQVRGIIKF